MQVVSLYFSISVISSAYQPWWMCAKCCLNKHFNVNRLLYPDIDICRLFLFHLQEFTSVPWWKFGHSVMWHLLRSLVGKMGYSAFMDTAARLQFPLSESILLYVSLLELLKWFYLFTFIWWSSVFDRYGSGSFSLSMTQQRWINEAW